MEILADVDGLCADPLHLFENAHCIVICLAPEHAAADDHVIVDVLELLCKLLAERVELFLARDQVLCQTGILRHELVVLVERAGVLHESAEQADGVGVDRLAQIGVFCRAVEFIIGIFADGGVVVGDVDHRARACLLAELCGGNDFLGVARAGREDADGVLRERLMPHDHELGSDDSVRLDLVGRRLQPVHHRQRVGVGTAAADEKQVGIALRANLVDCLFNLRTQRDGAVDNLGVAIQINIVHVQIPPNSIKSVYIGSGALRILHRSTSRFLVTIAV